MPLPTRVAAVAIADDTAEAGKGDAANADAKGEINACMENWTSWDIYIRYSEFGF